MSDTMMKELTEAVHYAYRLGYVSADRAHEMQLHIEALVEQRDEARAEAKRENERAHAYYKDFRKAMEAQHAAANELYDIRTEGQEDPLLKAARQVTDAAFQQAEIDRLKRELEQAIAERTPHDYGILVEQRDQYKQLHVGAIQKLDKARAEVEQLKQALHDARLENSGQAAQLEQAKHHLLDATKMIRPEPSRLEIAAMLVAGRFSSTLYVTEVKGTWIKYALEGADALIASAKEGK